MILLFTNQIIFTPIQEEFRMISLIIISLIMIYKQMIVNWVFIKKLNKILLMKLNNIQFITIENSNRKELNKRKEWNKKISGISSK